MDRRDFLKRLAAAGAFASAAGLVAVPELAAPRNAQAAGRSKLIFISDLHMNVDAGYSWLVSHAGDLADFLKDVNTRDDVAELVILGDLVDDWVSPIGDTPQSFSDVLDAGNNAGIVANLQAICANPNIAVTYVVGNHDMLSFQSQNKDTLADYFPGMTILSDAPGMGAYSKNRVIWAEHGHRYTLFNAPDTWSRSGSHLPLGYFISRLAASKSVSSGEVYTTPDVLDQFVKSPTQAYQGAAGDVFSDLVIIAVFNAIARWSGNWPWSQFTMKGLDDYYSAPSVEHIAFLFDTIFSGWPSRQDRVAPVEAVFNDLGQLNSAANLIFEMPYYIKDLYPFTPRIVIFGHTHEAAFQYHSGSVETIYVNTGTWIDKKPMTWVEVDISEGENGQTFYEVALWYHGDSSPKQTGTISV